jgi:hypothetical protein
MIKSEPYNLEIVMNKVLRRDIEIHVRADKIIPGDPACNAPVLVRICRGKWSS